jgi:hypothetical protein
LQDELLCWSYDHWQSVVRARNGRLPCKADLDPLALPRRLLPHVMLAESVETDGHRRWKYRLVGSAITNEAGQDPTGRFFDEVLAPSYAAYLIGLYESVRMRRLPLFSQSLFSFGDDWESVFRSTKRLMLPIACPDASAEDGSAVGLVFAVQTFQHRKDGRPTRFLSRPFEAGQSAFVMGAAAE